MFIGQTCFSVAPADTQETRGVFLQHLQIHKKHEVFSAAPADTQETRGVFMQHLQIHKEQEVFFCSTCRYTRNTHVMLIALLEQFYKTVVRPFLS